MRFPCEFLSVMAPKNLTQNNTLLSLQNHLSFSIRAAVTWPIVCVSVRKHWTHACFFFSQNVGWNTLDRTMFDSFLFCRWKKTQYASTLLLHLRANYRTLVSCLSTFWFNWNAKLSTVYCHVLNNQILYQSRSSLMCFVTNIILVENNLFWELTHFRV